MQLNSYEFLLGLLPVTLILYFTVGRFSTVIRKLILCGSGLVLYAAGGKTGLLIFIASIVMNFILSEIMMEREFLRKPVMILTVLMNIGILFLFKYADFTIYNLNNLTGKHISYLNLALPLGISFFTFQQIAYVVSLYRGKLEKPQLLDYLTYVLDFPKIIMGPIVEPVDLIAEFNDQKCRKWDWENFISGIKLVSFGLFKKMVIADTFALAVSWGAENSAVMTSLDQILVMLAYTFEIYFDFSGYTDMATGVSVMLNIKLPMNFDSPYKALSVRDFWGRWHMSLTNFFTRYIYIPLGGSRSGVFRTYLNTLIVFTISGIWHGDDWTFILWGVLYGVMMVFERMTGKVLDRIWKPIRWAVTFIVTNFMWLLFNAGSVVEWIKSIKKIFSFGSMTVSSGLASVFRVSEAPFLEDLLHIGSMRIFTSGIGWMAVYMLSAFFICVIPENNYRSLKKNNYLMMVLAALAFAWGFIYLGTESVFIYNYF